MHELKESHLAETKEGKPVPKRVGRKGAPPPRGDTLGVLGREASERHDDRKNGGQVAKATGKDRKEPLKFLDTPAFRWDFKRAAAAHDCKKAELLERIVAEWSACHPA